MIELCRNDQLNHFPKKTNRTQSTNAVAFKPNDFTNIKRWTQIGMQPIGNGKVNTISIDQGGTLIRAKSYKTSGVSISGGEHVE